MVNQMIKDNKMDENHTFWCANIHYDTDNIHIHIATSEEKKHTKNYKRRKIQRTI